MRQTVRCQTCGTLKQNVPADRQLAPCAVCHTKNWIVIVRADRDIPRLHEEITTKTTRGGKMLSETVAGDDRHRASGKWNFKFRLIDRKANRYQETIVDPDTGQIVRNCQELLSKHRDHGSAKKKCSTTDRTAPPGAGASGVQ